MGKIAGQPYEREIALNLPEGEPANDVLATLWARTRIDDLWGAGLNTAEPKRVAEVESQITDLGLEFRLMTKFTSFVAVEDRIVNQDGKPVTIQVPVALPDGVSPTDTSARNVETSPSAVGFSSMLNSSPWAVASIVNVTGAEPAVDATSSSVTTVIRPNRELSPRTRSSAGKSEKKSGKGVGYGTGSGSVSGSGAGNASAQATLPIIVSSGVVSPPVNAGSVKPSTGPKNSLKEKLHTWLFALVDRLRTGGTTPASNELLFVRDGKAAINIDLISKSPEILAKLKEAGFELSGEKGKMRVTGRIAVERLGDLAKIAEVKLILPWI